MAKSYLENIFEIYPYIQTPVMAQFISESNRIWSFRVTCDIQSYLKIATVFIFKHCLVISAKWYQFSCCSHNCRVSTFHAGRGSKNWKGLRTLSFWFQPPSIRIWPWCRPNQSQVRSCLFVHKQTVTCWATSITMSAMFGLFAVFICSMPLIW